MASSTILAISFSVILKRQEDSFTLSSSFCTPLLYVSICLLMFEKSFPYNKEEHKKALYTEVTRAQDKLVVVTK